MLDSVGMVAMNDDDEAGSSDATCNGPGTGGRPLCGRPVKAKGKCQSHYLQERAKQPLRPLEPRRQFVEGGATRRYGLRWPDPDLLQYIEDLAIAETKSVEDLLVKLVGERVEQLVGKKDRS